jgi:putative oxidoreductase
MKIATIVARSLLGLVFVVFGTNKFLHFLPNPPMQGAGAQFMGAMFETHYIYVIATCEIVGGLLLITGRYLPLGLCLVGPVVVNILSFHIFMDNSGLPVALVVAALALFLLWRHREHFAGLVKPVQPARRETASVGSPAQAARTGGVKN